MGNIRGDRKIVAEVGAESKEKSEVILRRKELNILVHLRIWDL